MVPASTRYALILFCPFGSSGYMRLYINLLILSTFPLHILNWIYLVSGGQGETNSLPKKTTSVYDNPPNILRAQGHAWWTRPQDTKPHAKSAAHKSSSGNQKKWNMFLNTCCHSFTKTASPLLSSAQPICFFVQFGTSLGASPFAWPPSRLQPSSSSALCTLVFTSLVQTSGA